MKKIILTLFLLVGATSATVFAQENRNVAKAQKENQENEKDLTEIPDNVKKGMDIILINTVDEVLKHALVKPLSPIEWDEEAEMAKEASKLKKQRDGEAGEVVKH